jgi:hypothetical protein
MYFAVCPKAVMAGGRLHIQIDVGPVSAWCDAWLDMLILFRPFHYMIDVGVSVGISFNIDILFVHIHIRTSSESSMQLMSYITNKTAQSTPRCTLKVPSLAALPTSTFISSAFQSTSAPPPQPYLPLAWTNFSPSSNNPGPHRLAPTKARSTNP